MNRVMLTGNGAAAWGARLAKADYVPAFPITPQTEIIENIAAWIDRNEMGARLVTLESEHSMITAAGAAAATGVRVFTATSSQGLLYGMEMMYTVYCDHVGLPLPVERSVRWPGAKWICWRTDLCSALSYYRRGQLSLGDWLRSVRGRRWEAEFHWNDPGPFLCYLRAAIRRRRSAASRRGLRARPTAHRWL